MQKNHGFYILSCTILLVIIVLSTGCVGGVQGKLIGKWIERDGDLTYEFFRDGTFIGEKGSISLAGEYKIVGDDHLILQAGGTSSSIQFAINDDVLTAYGPFSSEPIIFDRATP